MGVKTGSLAISVAVVLCLVVLLVEHVDKSVALKCYACPLRGDCPDNNRGSLQACTYKDPVCYENVRRNPILDKDGKPTKHQYSKGCMGKEHMEEKFRGKMGCAYLTEHMDFCQCDSDRCNPGDDWPPRDESAVPK